MKSRRDQSNTLAIQGGEIGRLQPDEKTNRMVVFKNNDDTAQEKVFEAIITKATNVGFLPALNSFESTASLITQNRSIPTSAEPMALAKGVRSEWHSLKQII